MENNPHMIYEPSDELEAEYIRDGKGDIHPLCDRRARDRIEEIENDILRLSDKTEVENSFEIRDSILRHTYENTDLTEKFASEIEEHGGDPWAWIKSRISRGNYKGIMTGDYINIEMTDNERGGKKPYKIQIMGIDTYTGTYNADRTGTLGHHIDFMSEVCYGNDVTWKDVRNNNGTVETQCPYLASNVYSHLISEVYDALPQNVKNVITDKGMLMEFRYSEDGEPLKDPLGYKWRSLGKVWAPLEFEIFGALVRSPLQHGAGLALQYPLFAHTYKNLLKYKYKPDGSLTRVDWWTASICGNSTGEAVVAGYGARFGMVTEYKSMPLCFRVAQ